MIKQKLRARYLLWGVPTTLFLIVVSVLLTNLLTDNVHTVLPGQLYRSAELEKKPLTRVVNAHKIKTIINLRGVHPADSWYQAEIQLSNQRHLLHYTLKLPAHGLATRAEIRRLVHVLQNAPKPILVHCRQGADRTGLASAIAIILSGNTDPHDVKRQISWVYNVLSPKSVGYQVLENYFSWLKASDQPYGRTSFLVWVNSSAPLQSYQGNYLL